MDGLHRMVSISQHPVLLGKRGRGYIVWSVCHSILCYWKEGGGLHRMVSMSQLPVLLGKRGGFTSYGQYVTASCVTRKGGGGVVTSYGQYVTASCVIRKEGGGGLHRMVSMSQHPVLLGKRGRRVTSYGQYVIASCVTRKDGGWGGGGVHRMVSMSLLPVLLGKGGGAYIVWSVCHCLLCY